MSDRTNKSGLRTLIIFLLSMILGSIIAVTSWHFPLVAQVVWAPGGFLVEHLYPGGGLHDTSLVRGLMLALAANSIYLGLIIFGACQMLLYFKSHSHKFR